MLSIEVKFISLSLTVSDLKTNTIRHFFGCTPPEDIGIIMLYQTSSAGFDRHAEQTNQGMPILGFFPFSANQNKKRFNI
jgi:hypothetical protein